MEIIKGGVTVSEGFCFRNSLWLEKNKEKEI